MHVRGVEVSLRMLAEVFHPAERLLAGTPFTVQFECFFGELSLRHLFRSGGGLIVLKWTDSTNNTLVGAAFDS